MNVKRIISVLLAISLVVSVFVITASAETTLKLNWKTATIGLGEKYKFKATTNSTKSIKWITSDKTVVFVDETGLVKGVKTGKAIVTATVNGVSASVTITVKKAPDKIFANDITFNQGDTTEININLPTGTTSKSLYYESSNNKIAKINSKGIVTGVSTGECIITITTFKKKM